MPRSESRKSSSCDAVVFRERPLDIVCSHSNPSQKIKVGRRCTPRGDPTNQLPCALRVYSPVDSHTCQTPWSVFQDGSNGEPTGQRPERADAEARRRRALLTTIEKTAFHEHIESPGFGRPPIHAGPRPGSIGVPARRRSTYDWGASSAPIRFPPDNFKHSLTFFSKSFSSFRRGTCSLTGPSTTGLSPSPAPPSRGLGPGPLLRTLLQTTIRTTVPPDSKAGLFPIRSPLLRESLQTCPRPNGFGRNLRSKTRWFTGFCNLHQVSHFAMFFIDARAEISVAESRFRLQRKHRRSTGPPMHAADGARGEVYRFKYSLALSALGFIGRPPGTGGGARAECRSTPPAWTPQYLNTFAGSFCCAGFDNDPPAGSPMETLL
ncbi:hypothetical protein CQW23_34575 [Capsicum baccatum]|uniref:Protein TAR1 n=1 Tax=Capsicum baccatum TaxID=33114 RepID=A0A2G2UYF6_CAPBA|nr:hypothetical protein CQW23_34575 [Capsicum baccatum]